MAAIPPGPERRASIGRARLMLLFTPELCARGSEPLAVLDAALPHVDVVQVRIKSPVLGSAPARATYEWALAVLERVERVAPDVLVLVDDRVDVAGVLAGRGIAGVHLGTSDSPPALARALLGADGLIGLSTHGAADVVAAEQEPVDYLGFGPVFPSTTRGNVRGLGSEAAWIAARSTHRPLFPIGGIDAANALELAPVGRAAVSSAILGARDPGRAARELRGLLGAADAE